jgi:hypothetical protein
MPRAERDDLRAILDRLDLILHRQDALEARCQHLEARLGIAGPPTERVPVATLVRSAILEAPSPAPASPSSEPAALRDSPARAPLAPAALRDSPPEPAALRASPGGSAPAGAPALQAARGTPVEPPALRTARATPAGAPTFEARVGLQWLNRIGVITLLLGVAFGFKTAVDNGWIGPAARIALGAGAGLASLAIAELQVRFGHRVFAQGLTGLGLALLYLTWWAAFALYGLVPQPIAFALMVATTVAAGLLALRYHASAIAVVALVGGYATPVALASAEPHALFFLAYLTALNAAAIVLARRRAWPVVETVTMVATVVAYGGWLATAMTPADRAIATGFAGVFYLQLALARSRAPWYVAQLAAPFVVAGLWLTTAPELRLALVVAAALAGLGVAARRQSPAAATWTALWFWLAELACAAIEPATGELVGASVAFAAVLAWIAWSQRRGLAGRGLAIVALNPTALLGTAAILLGARQAGVVGFALVAVQLGLARGLRGTAAGRLAGLVGHLLALAALALEIVSWIDRSVGEVSRAGAITVASSLLLACYGLFAIVLGVARRRARDRVLGLVLLALAVVKLYAYDVWSLGRGFQVAAFLALGALLLVVSYLYSRYRDVLGRLWSDAPAA